MRKEKVRQAGISVCVYAEWGYPREGMSAFQIDYRWTGFVEEENKVIKPMDGKRIFSPSWRREGIPKQDINFRS